MKHGKMQKKFRDQEKSICGLNGNYEVCQKDHQIRKAFVQGVGQALNAHDFLEKCDDI